MRNSSAVMLVVRDLRKAYRSDREHVQGVRSVSFEVAKGEFYTLLGPSGCGKTTTLRSIAGLETPDQGEIIIGDEVVFSSSRGINVPIYRRELGMVFQSYAIWPHMTVFDNVAFPLRQRRKRVSRSELEGRVYRALSFVHLENEAHRLAPLLSGGQQQRVALARALVYEPRLLLLDEPLSNLDAKLRDDMRSEIRDLTRQLGITTLYVTHDQVEALTMSQRIAVMQNGVIVQEGQPRDIYGSPATGFVAMFVGKTNFLKGRVGRADHDYALVDTAGGTLRCKAGRVVESGAEVTVAIRPEAIRVVGPTDSGANVFSATVRSLAFHGDFVECVAEVSGECIRIKLDAYHDCRLGDELRLLFPPERCALLPEAVPIE